MLNVSLHFFYAHYEMELLSQSFWCCGLVLSFPELKKVDKIKESYESLNNRFSTAYVC